VLAEIRFEPLVTLPDAPTGDENDAIGATATRFSASVSGQPAGPSRIFMTKPRA
jgi:hypothetical protein